MLNTFKSIVLLLQTVKNLRNINKNLEILAKTSQLTLKLKLMQLNIPPSDLESYNFDASDEEDEVLLNNERILQQFEVLEAEYTRRFGTAPSKDLSLEQLQNILNQA